MASNTSYENENDGAIGETPKLRKRPSSLDLELLNAPKKKKTLTEDSIRCLNYTGANNDTIKIRSDERGATISCGEKKWIRMSKEGFKNLKNLILQIDEAMIYSRERRWLLEEKIYVSTRFFNNKMNVDIRIHVPVISVEDDIESSTRPTKCGVFLSIGQWRELRKNLRKHTCEDSLKSSALGGMTVECLAFYIFKDLGMTFDEMLCDGCVNEWPSQTDHACCMQDDFLKLKHDGRKDYLKKVQKRVDISKFAFALAQKGMNRGVELTRTPRYLLNRAVDDWSEDLLNELKLVQDNHKGLKEINDLVDEIKESLNE